MLSLVQSVVIKPVDGGSSVDLSFASHRSALELILSRIHEGRWLVEQYIRGRELTVGVLDGSAMGIVEVISPEGVYDYNAKYTPGVSEYVYPAELESSMEAAIKAQSEQLFRACGCRDFARIDFLVNGRQPFFLEINTLPGLTTNSLLPKSAICLGYDFKDLANKLVAGGIQRLKGCEEKIGSDDQAK